MKKHSGVSVLCQVFVVVVCVLLSAAATAGDFEGTFSSRLTCPYASWYEGRVTSNTGNVVSVDVIKELLGNAPHSGFNIKFTTGFVAGLKRGDTVLVFSHQQHPVWLRRSACPGGGRQKTEILGVTDRKLRIVTDSGTPLEKAILSWYYHSGRWDAELVSKQTGYGKYAVYAQLPSGEQYLIIDDRYPKRPPDYLAPKNTAPKAQKKPWKLTALLGIATVVLLFSVFRFRNRF